MTEDHDKQIIEDLGFIKGTLKSITEKISALDNRITYRYNEMEHKVENAETLIRGEVKAIHNRVSVVEGRQKKQAWTVGGIILTIGALVGAVKAGFIKLIIGN